MIRSIAFTSRQMERIPPRSGWSMIAWAIACWCAIASLGAAAFAGDLDDAEALFRAGKYDECAQRAADQLKTGLRVDEWAQVKIASEMARGKYAAALATYEDAVKRYPWSVALRLMGRDVFRYNGRDADAAGELDAIERLLLGMSQRFISAEGRLAIGRFFLIRDADARKVLNQFYDVVTKQNPELVDGFLATAELALGKDDLALAAESLQKAPKESAEDPRFHYLMARAFADNRPRAAAAIASALKLNPNHVDSLLLLVDQRIDDERYDEAEKVLEQVFAVNPSEPRGWAYRAVLAHLRNDAESETSARQSALEHWKLNPEVDHLIGEKLSQKYRFAEGSAYQRLALAFDADYLPARVQLCQDLLRLGDEEEGWKLANAIFNKDGYNVVAFNLVNLHDRINKFRTLEADGFVVRMEPREADLYGGRVLALLSRARKTLVEKFGVMLTQPVIVEIFPARKEFGVRTFGLPGGAGLLGVCFGRVVTAVSPAAQGEDPSNWEAVLWHEFCHVVTLTKSQNKMPRWLSEGISVFEEKQENPAWETTLNPRFRERLLDPKLTPLSQLSSAFLTAETSLDLQFAYFESALAVEFLVQTFGRPALNGLLSDLGLGIPINQALPKWSKTSLSEMDQAFATFARKKAESVAPGATWDEPELPPNAHSDAIADWLKSHPDSFPGRQRFAARLLAEEEWDSAEKALQSLKKLYPEYVGPENAYVMLASLYKRNGDARREHAILDELVARDAGASPALLRLMELDEAAQDWPGLARNARRMLAVNPLVAAPHRMLARAADQLGLRDEAIEAYRALALLDETDPAGVHFRLARLLRDAGKTAEARREVLRSLEEAPRYLDAHRLLLELVGAQPKARPR